MFSVLLFFSGSLLCFLPSLHTCPFPTLFTALKHWIDYSLLAVAVVPEPRGSPARLMAVCC